MREYTAAEYLARWAEIESRSFDALSLADWMTWCDDFEPGTTEALLDSLGPKMTTKLAFIKEYWLRPKQLAITEFTAPICFYCGGRGGGKTRPAAEWMIERIQAGSQVNALIGPTESDIERFMLGGFKRRTDSRNGSGIFDCLPPWMTAIYKKDAGQVLFPDYNAVIYLHSAELPEYRGDEPESIWGDELLKWRYGPALLANLRMACRAKGPLRPQQLYTTSPAKRKWLRDLVMDPEVVTFNAQMNENRGNIDEIIVDNAYARLAGTREGEEELLGRLGIDQESDMFKQSVIDQERRDAAPFLDTVVVAVDPAGTNTRRSDQTGISVCGRQGPAQSLESQGYVLADRTGKYQWEAWGALVVKLAIDWDASAIVIESNKLNDGTLANIRTNIPSGWTVRPRPGFRTLDDLVAPNGRRIQLIGINTTSAKQSRAGPVSTLYEKRRIHHVGRHTELELELEDFPNNPNSPNRVDAMVHAFTELFALDRPARITGEDAMDGFAEANDRLAASAPDRGSESQPLRGERNDRGRAL